MDDKKIEEAANKHIETEYARYNSGEVEEEMICLRGKDSFKAGANWAINDFLKDLWHDGEEVPKEKNKSVLMWFESYSVGERELDNDEYYDLCNTGKEGYDEDTWEMICNEGGLCSKWLYLDDLQKGGKQ